MKLPEKWQKVVEQNGEYIVQIKFLVKMKNVSLFLLKNQRNFLANPIIERCRIPFTQFPPIVIYCKTMVQYHNHGLCPCLPYGSLCPHSLWFCRPPSCFPLLWVPSKSLINISCNSFVSCSDHNLLILPRCHAKPSSAAEPATTAHDSAPQTEELSLWPQGLRPALATHSFQVQGTILSPFLFCQE